VTSNFDGEQHLKELHQCFVYKLKGYYHGLSR